MRFVLMGHRGAGKTTLARLLHEKTGWKWTDLDEAIERREERSCAEIIAESEALFRRLERETFEELIAEPGSDPEIISVGGGFSGYVDGPIYIWIRRGGWVDVAAAEREQVWPELTITEELARMRTEREPRWARAAHIVCDIPRARSEARAARDLYTRLDWLTQLSHSDAVGRTWAVPAGPHQFDRALRDREHFGLAGVEVRSDLFDQIPDTASPLILSVRSRDPEWLRGSAQHIIDIDVSFLPAVLSSGILDRLDPRPLILSTHPDGVDSGDVERLARAAHAVGSQHPEWTEIELKYAPLARSAFEAGAGLAMMRPLRNRDYAVTYIPQGRRFAWLRPVLLNLMNARNYLPVGISSHRHEAGTQSVGAAWDLVDWLPHLVSPPPRQFDALIGEPVDASQGDLWHRRAALEAGEPSGYLKVNAAESELEDVLSLFEGIGVRGVSVTSPHKFAVRNLPGVQAPPDLEAANTLRRTGFGWEATDTDTVGMVGALRELEALGVEPGPVAVIGMGGVSDAVARGIVASPGWSLGLHVGAREGWPDEPGRFRLVVNAAGQYGYHAEGSAPAADAWLDLHYTGALPPPGDYLHVIGDAFFEFQAREQRAFWKRSVES